MPKAKDELPIVGEDLNPSGNLDYEVAEVNPQDLSLLEKNAHFMPEQTFKQLCDNIRRDGCLTSAPLVIQRDGKQIVLSGNHRVKASLAVGLKTIPILRLKGEIDEQRQIAIQLAHNALVGEDDPNLLKELYDSLDMLEQRYSGLTDQDLGVLDDPELATLTVGLPKFEEMTISFLPDDLTELKEHIEKLKLRMADDPVYMARLEDYIGFFKAFCSVKEAEKIGNDGVALLKMSELALAHIEAREEGADGKA